LLELKIEYTKTMVDMQNGYYFFIHVSVNLIINHLIRAGIINEN